MNVLLTSAGRRVQLLENFRAAGAETGTAVRVLAVDLNPDLSAACHAADARWQVPRCADPEYVPELVRLCARERVDLLVPTIDPELLVLSRSADAFREVGTRVVVPAPEIVALAGDKLRTAEVLATAGISTPATLRLGEYLENPGRLPGTVIAKPNGGSASIGLVRPKTVADLAGLDRESYIVQARCAGPEYTVNVFFDQGGNLRCAVPHQRLEVRSGEVSKGVTRRVAVLEEIAGRLARALTGLRGALCFQAFETGPQQFTVFEINARFGGGYPLAHRAGATFTTWLVQEALGQRCTAHNDWREGVTMLRYDAAVFSVR